MKTLTLLSIFCLVPAAFAAETKSEVKAEANAEAPAEPKVAKGKAAKDLLPVQKEGKSPKAAPRPDGLVIEDVKMGGGKAAALGSKITVHYRGTLKNGKVFDSSYERKEPITFDLLEGRLIKGWTEGIPGMKVGGKRKLHIPYAMAYGDRGTPDGAIPPKSDLNFEVELVDVK